jgi:hypothetical protein
MWVNLRTSAVPAHHGLGVRRVLIVDLLPVGRRCACPTLHLLLSSFYNSRRAAASSTKSTAAAARKH